METVDTACVGAQRHVVLRGRHAGILQEREREGKERDQYVCQVKRGREREGFLTQRSKKLTLILLLSPSGARSERVSRTLIRQRVGSILSSDQQNESPLVAEPSDNTKG